jgi:tripartite-type tricarboxylate transporter receptor subunit TctC
MIRSICAGGRLLAAWSWFVFAVVAALAADSAFAQGAYPAKPVRMVVSYGAGNVTDTLARIVCDRLSQKWGQPVVVDNRPGQGGSLGAASVAHVPADGYTLLFSAMAAFGINPHVYRSVGYEMRDFTPIIGVAYPRLAFVAAPQLNVNSFTELVQYSKTHPINYGSTGNGTVPQLNMEALKAQTGLVAEHVPYKSATAALTDLIGGRVQLQMETLSVLLPQIKSGNIRPIAVMSNKRLPQLPNVPAISELVPGLVPITPWLGIFAPAGLPQPVVDKIYHDVDAIIREPGVQEKLQANVMDTLAANPADFARLVQSDDERIGKLARDLKLQVD